MAIFSGTDLDDTLTASSLDDSVFGLSGNDILSGISGEDRLYGGSGLDRLFGGDAADRLYGGALPDTLSGGSGLDRLYGETGSDRLFAQSGQDRLFGGSGNDTAFGAARSGEQRVYGGDGKDTFLFLSSGQEQDFTVFGGTGDDLVNVPAGDDELGSLFFQGDAGTDTLVASQFLNAVTFYGGEGLDQLSGTDTYHGLPVGTLFADGGDGDDELRVHVRRDATVALGDGADVLRMSGADVQATVFGGSGNDSINVGNVANVSDNRAPVSLFGGSGSDHMLARGGSGTHLLEGSLGNDRLYLRASTGANEVSFYGGEGNDTAVLQPGTGDVSALVFDAGGGTVNDLFVLESVGHVLFNGGDGSDRLSGYDIATLHADGGDGDDDLRARVKSDATVTLGDGADFAFFSGADVQATVFGGSGNDSINVGNNSENRAPVSLFGGSGSDRIFARGGSGAHLLEGALGNDLLVLRASTGANEASFYGGQGNDTASLQAGTGDVGAVLFEAGSGADTLTLDESVGYLLFDGASGADRLSGGNVLSAVIDQGLGDDYARLAAAGGVTLFGGSGNDTQVSGNGRDTLSGGSGIDKVDGNDGDDLLLAGSGEIASGDTFDGGSGSDTLGLVGAAALGSGAVLISVEVLARVGTGGSDTLSGSAGDDLLIGFSGADTGFGGSGADTFVVASGQAAAGESFDGGSGLDTLVLGSGVAASLVAVEEVESLRQLGSTQADSLVGFGGDDLLSGLGGDDDLRGRSGNDLLRGDGGRDALRGEQGDDSLFGGLNQDTLLGAAGDDLQYGGSANDRLGGGSGADSLFGGEDSDLLNGGSGVDTAAGGAVNDTYVVDTAADLVLETAAGGLADLVRSNASDYTLATGVEGFVERGNINFGIGEADLAGNDADNTLLGNEAANRLAGGSGTDTLNGRSGSDTLTGGSGDDTFVVDTVGDEVREFDGQGSDLVRSRVSYTLPDGTAGASLENLRLDGGSETLNAAGNGVDNAIEGNNGANLLRGLGGDDTLFGGNGDDLLSGGSGLDRLRGEAGADTLLMASLDEAFGGSGGDAFFFDGTTLGNAGSGGPTVRDFDGVSLGAGEGEDKLVFATGLEVGSFVYLGGAAFSGSGDSEARFAGSRQVQVDRDGDGTVDQAFLVNGVTDPGLLTAADFLWL